MADNGGKPKAHTVEDHLYGMMSQHEHGPDSDHDHDDFDHLGPLDENPIWLQDNVFLNSVGLDVGSSGTQAIFSRLQMRRVSEDLTSRYIVVARETVYESPVALTPYSDAFHIDGQKLGEIVDDAYHAAGLQPHDIDTGVVILTGEALRRENAEAIAQILAEQGGDFVCATAGHHMEARLAAYGSGAAKASYDLGKRLLNVDIGGGTTKLAIVENGEILRTGAIHIGGRLLVAEENGNLTRLDPAGQHHAQQAGFDWSVGSNVSKDELRAVAARMAGLVVEALKGGALSDEIRHLYLTDPITDFGPIEGVMVSGGVGEYVYGKEDRDFGDLGLALGTALRERLTELPFPLLASQACIRATALGASEYTVQLSGNTSFISDRGKLLPRRDLQVIHPKLELGEAVDAESVAAAIRDHIVQFDLFDADRDIAVAFRWQGVPEYSRLRGFAEGLRDGLADRTAKGQPVYVMLDGDVARSVGLILKDELALPVEILVIDGLELHDFDFIDLGKVRLPSGTVPVTIKSLLFRDAPGERVHHHTVQTDGHHHGGHHHHHHDGYSHDHSHTHDDHHHGHDHHR